MEQEIEWLKKGGDRVLCVNLGMHHAPIYLTLLMDNIIELCYDIDYPTREKDIPVSVPPIDSIEKMIENSEEIKRKDLENSPYLEVNEKPEPLIPHTRALRVELPSYDGKTTVQDLIQLQNGKHISLDTEPSGDNFIIGLTPGKIKEKLIDDDVRYQSLPKTTVDIPLNPLSYIPDGDPSLSQNK